jgi:hypothetical protein
MNAADAEAGDMTVDRRAAPLLTIEDLSIEFRTGTCTPSTESVSR